MRMYCGCFSSVSMIFFRWIQFDSIKTKICFNWFGCASVTQLRRKQTNAIATWLPITMQYGMHPTKYMSFLIGNHCNKFRFSLWKMHLTKASIVSCFHPLFVQRKLTSGAFWFYVDSFQFAQYYDQWKTHLVIVNRIHCKWVLARNRQFSLQSLDG